MTALPQTDSRSTNHRFPDRPARLKLLLATAVLLAVPPVSGQIGSAAEALSAGRGRKPCHCRKLRFRIRRPVRPRCARPCTAPAEKPDPYAWKNLFDGKTLTGWKTPEFGGEGKVVVKDGMIVMEMGNMMTGVTWTGEVPRVNYELSLEGMKLDGTDFFCTTTFPVGEEPCSLVVGGWGGTVVGLSNVDFYDAANNMTATFNNFQKDKWYWVRIRVTEAKIEAWIDDEKIVEQERKGHKFGIRFEVELCQPLGISTWCTSGAVRNVRIRKLKPEEFQSLGPDEEQLE